MYRVAYPKCTAAEIIAFMARTSPRAHITGLYNASAVSRAERNLDSHEKKDPQLPTKLSHLQTLFAGAFIGRRTGHTVWPGYLVEI